MWCREKGGDSGDFQTLRYWVKSYGTRVRNESYAIQQAGDGGYIVLGGIGPYDGSLSGSQHDVWLLKLDLYGGIDWQKAYGGSDDEYGSSIRVTSAGDYIVASSIWHPNSSFYDMWLLRIDVNGNILWQKKYDNSINSDRAISILETNDNGFIVAGTTYSRNTDTTDTLILKIDFSGTVIWAKSYGDGSSESVASFQNTLDVGYIVAGTCYSSGNIWVRKLDSLGEIEWQKSFSETKRSRHMRQNRDLTLSTKGKDHLNTSEFEVVEIDKSNTKDKIHEIENEKIEVTERRTPVHTGSGHGRFLIIITQTQPG